MNDIPEYQITKLCILKVKFGISREHYFSVMCIRAMERGFIR